VVPVVEAHVIDPQHLALAEPVGYPPGTAVVLSIDPVVEDAQASTPSPAQTLPELRVFALGSARVFRGDQEITSSSWKYAKTRELFFFLLCHSPQNKEQIGAALWPETSPTHLRANFRVALYHLRSALGHSEWILYENEHYTFNRVLPLWFDVEVFKQHIESGGRVYPAETRGQSGIFHFQSAIDLYHGQFLEGWNAGEWHCPLRDELERKYLDALLVLGRLYAAHAEYPRAVEAFRRVTAVDGFLEEAHRETMRCFIQMGEYGQAVRHYQEFSDLMRDELGLAPSPVTQALYEQLRQKNST
jgi:DNA-binding SARP family transcriptional activator